MPPRGAARTTRLRLPLPHVPVVSAASQDDETLSATRQRSAAPPGGRDPPDY